MSFLKKGSRVDKVLSAVDKAAAIAEIVIATTPVDDGGELRGLIAEVRLDLREVKKVKDAGDKAAMLRQVADSLAALQQAGATHIKNEKRQREFLAYVAAARVALELI
jgi:hypothetical protein